MLCGCLCPSEANRLVAVTVSLRAKAEGVLWRHRQPLSCFPAQPAAGLARTVAQLGKSDGATIRATSIVLGKTVSFCLWKYLTRISPGGQLYFNTLWNTNVKVTLERKKKKKAAKPLIFEFLPFLVHGFDLYKKNSNKWGLDLYRYLNEPKVLLCAYGYKHFC